MKTIRIIIIFSLICTKIFAQVNLINNGDFELHSSIPTTANEVNKAIGWNNVNNIYGTASSSGTPDYYYVGGWMMSGIITPFSGNGQVGLGTWSNNDLNYREYISTYLLVPLDIGRKYTFSFYLYHNFFGTITNNCSKSTNNLGFCFSIYPLNQYFIEPIKRIPQIEIDTIINFTNTWKKYTFIYTPDSAYQRITIGNFRNDSVTSVSVSGTTCSYYCFDKIEMYPIKLKIIGDTLICKGDTINMHVYGDSIVKWANTFNPNNILYTGYSFTATPNVTTTYIAYGHWDTAYITVHVANIPVVNLGNDTALCPHDTLYLNVSTLYASYMWQDSSAFSAYKVTKQGIYWVKVSIDSSCFASDTINVIYNSNPVVNLGNDTILCYGQETKLDALQASATYLWQDGSTSHDYIIKPPYSPYVFWVKVTINNCTSTDSIEVHSIPLPIIPLGNIILCPGQSILLDVTTPNVSYLWQDSTVKPTYIISHEGLYWIKLTDSNNCSSTDTIELSYQNCNIPIYIPNTFTPNGDGINDLFKIESTYLIYDFRLMIYSRWKDIVFESTDINIGWDGSYKGKIVPQGLYIYLLTGIIKNTGEQIKRTGSVTVLR